MHYLEELLYLVLLPMVNFSHICGTSSLKIGQERDPGLHPAERFVNTPIELENVDETLDPQPGPSGVGAQPQGDGMPRIISATKRGKYNVILEELNRGIPVNTTDSEGGTPLYWSACRGDVKLTRFLLNQGADVNHKVRWESTPLHAAADRGHKECVECLLNWNADVNAQNRNQDTPLHLAAYRGYYQVCLLLLAYNASMSLLNIRGKTPHQEAKEAGHARIAKILNSTTKRDTFPLENKNLGDLVRNKFATENRDRPFQHGEYERQLSEPPSYIDRRRSKDVSYTEPLLLAGAAGSSCVHRSFPNLNTLSSFCSNLDGTSPYVQTDNPPVFRLSRSSPQVSQVSPACSRISPEMLRHLNRCTPLPVQRPIYIETDDRDVYTRIEDLELRLACAESEKSTLEQQIMQMRRESAHLRQQLSSYSVGMQQSGCLCEGGDVTSHMDSVNGTINQLRDLLKKERILRLEAESRARQAMKDMFTLRKRFDELFQSTVGDLDKSSSVGHSSSTCSFHNDLDKKGS